MNLCNACSNGQHFHCSAQVRAANAPCSCQHCWGIGGSKAAYKRLDDINSKLRDFKEQSEQDDKPFIVDN